jgi:thiol:disulfide interchange protein DsbA
MTGACASAPVRPHEDFPMSQPLSPPSRPATRRFLHGVAAGALALAAGPGRAQPAAPREGFEYRAQQPAQPTESGNRLEVLEFFWYGCPHCFSLESLLREWVRRQPADVALRKVHVALGPSWAPHQQLFYTIEAMGRSAELDDKVFAALHIERLTLDRPEKMADFLGRHGVDRKQFLDTYESFSVKTRQRKATQQASAWGLEGVPGLGVNGRWYTAPSMARGNAQALQVVDWLLEQERKNRK